MDAIKEKLTDYFDDYDYIIGDWAYGKLRLKGFCNKNNKMFNRTNNIENVESYLQNNCAYGCRWFKLKNNH